MALVNPEFQLWSADTSWQRQPAFPCPGMVWTADIRACLMYRSLKPAPAPAGGSGSGPLTLHPSVLFIRWRERSIWRSAGPDDGHYSKFLWQNTAENGVIHDEYFKRAQRCSDHFATKHNTCPSHWWPNSRQPFARQRWIPAGSMSQQRGAGLRLCVSLIY